MRVKLGCLVIMIAMMMVLGTCEGSADATDGIISAIASGTIDANDGKQPIYDLVDRQLVPRPGNYPYAYGPTAMYDHRDRLFKVWCAVGWNGDTIAYKESASLDGLYAHKWQIVLEPCRTDTPEFDQGHTCDPSVIAANGGYYLYWSGGNTTTKYTLINGKPNGGVGVAFSRDGKKFKRLNGGKPVVEHSKDPFDLKTGYGWGQPAVTKGPNGYYYMLYTYATDNRFDNFETNQLRIVRSNNPDFINHEIVAKLPRSKYSVSNDLVYDTSRNIMSVVVNWSLPGFGSTVSFYHFTPQFDTCIGISTYRRPEPADFALGEGICVITDPERRLMSSDPTYGVNAFTVLGASYRDRDGQPQHISGAVSYIAFGTSKSRFMGHATKK